MAFLDELLKRLRENTVGTPESGPGLLSPEVIRRAISPEGIGSAVRNLPQDLKNITPGANLGLVGQELQKNPFVQRTIQGFQQGTPNQPGEQQSGGGVTQQQIGLMKKIEEQEQKRKEEEERAKWIQRAVKLGIPLLAAVAGTVSDSALPAAAGFSKGFVEEGQRQEDQQLKRDELGVTQQKQERAQLEKITKRAQDSVIASHKAAGTTPSAEQMIAETQKLVEKIIRGEELGTKSIGDIVEFGGKSYKVIGFDPEDGDPLVDLIE
jgi:hypothetical protein